MGLNKSNAKCDIIYVVNPPAIGWFLRPSAGESEFLGVSFGYGLWINTYFHTIFRGYSHPFTIPAMTWCELQGHCHMQPLDLMLSRAYRIPPLAGPVRHTWCCAVISTCFGLWVKVKAHDAMDTQMWLQTRPEPILNDWLLQFLYTYNVGPPR